MTFAALDEEGQPLSDPWGKPGKYEVTFTLLQPGQAAERVKASGTTRIWEVQNEKIVGDSHLALTIPKDARPSSNAQAGVVVTVLVKEPDGSVAEEDMVLRPNRDGRLSKVSVTLQANDFSDAEARAYFQASTVLSDLAFQLGLPLRIAHTYVKETETKHVRVGFVRQFGYKGIGNLPTLGSTTKPNPYPALTSIYREALNSESPFYQFLCFCRIIERLKEKLRPGWEKVIVKHNKSLLPTYRKDERFLKEGQGAERFTAEVKGKKFYKVYDDHLRPLRNGIGHVFLEDMEDESSAERSTDEYDFVSRVYVYLPVAHHIAKTMLKNDFGQGGAALIAARLGTHSTGS